MFRFLIPLILALTSTTSLQTRSTNSGYSNAASEAQVKFAIENNYDDTGPGAKQPEYAYNAYKTLDDALIAYLDDPDTKLPEEERARATAKLLQSSKFFTKQEEPQKQYLASPAISSPNDQRYANPVGNSFFSVNQKAVPTRYDNHVGNYLGENLLDQFRFQKVQSVKGSPLSLAHYSRDPALTATSLNNGVPQNNVQNNYAIPRYPVLYGVNDKTPVSTSAQESRDGGIVRGYYSFIAPDGKTRTVYYTADDVQSLRTPVKHN